MGANVGFYNNTPLLRDIQVLNSGVLELGADGTSEFTPGTFFINGTLTLDSGGSLRTISNPIAGV